VADQVAKMPKKPTILIIMGDDIGWSNVSAYNLGLMGYRIRIMKLRPSSTLEITRRTPLANLTVHAIQNVSIFKKLMLRL
jgi:arylsulfatase A-like enzyme